MSAPPGPRNYVVTGAGGGIGGATTARLLDAGANVCGVDISSRRLKELTDRTEDSPGTLVTVKADVTTEEGATEAIASAVAAFDHLHGLANIAGGMPSIDLGGFDMPIEEISWDYFRANLDLNVGSAFLMSRAVAPFFYATGYGKIVNIASLAAFGNYHELGNAAYNSAKAAVVGLSQTLSMLMGSNGIRVNCIAPGLVLSPRVQGFISEDQKDRHLANAALSDLASPADVAETIAFFLDAASDAITGEVLRVAAGVR